MKGFLLLLLAFVSIGPVFAIDYSLCSSFLRNNGLGKILEIDNDGKFKAVSTKEFDSILNDFKKNKVVLKKNFKNKNNNKEIIDIEILAEKKDENQYKVSFKSTTSEMLYPSYYPGAFGFNYGYGHGYQVASKIKTQTDEDEMILYMGIKNEKCYPVQVSTVKPHMSINPMTMVKSYVYLSKDAYTEKCKKLLDFFEKNSNIKNCTDNNARALKELKKLLGHNFESYKVQNDLLKKLDENLTEASKLINISLEEMKLCASYHLGEAIKDETLWANNSKEASTKSDSTHEK